MPATINAIPATAMTVDTAHTGPGRCRCTAHCSAPVNAGPEPSAIMVPAATPALCTPLKKPSWYAATPIPPHTAGTYPRIPEPSPNPSPPRSAANAARSAPAATTRAEPTASGSRS